MNFDKLIAIFDADWDESKHPRAKNGQFGKGNGGSSAPAKEKKKSTMSKSYKALSSGQKADTKANVASQIKSMSKEKQISVANRVLKAQGKEPIVANKDGTYTWTNKGERVTTQKPPRIKSDKLARAIVSNGYAVPGIKTGVSTTASEPKSSKSESSSASSKPEYLTKKLEPVERHKLINGGLTKLGNSFMAKAHIDGVDLPYTDVKQTVEHLKAGFEKGAESFEEAMGSLPIRRNSLLNKRNYTFEKIAKGIASCQPKGSSNEGGMTKEQLSAAARYADKMNESRTNYQNYKKFMDTKLTPKLRKSIESRLDEAEDLFNSRAHDEGRDVRSSDLYQVTELIRSGLRSSAPNTSSLNSIVGIIRLSPKVGARYGDIANEILKDLHDIHK